MDAERFLAELPGALEDVSRFEALLEDVPGLARANNLALLNCAARCLEPGESYVEVGSYRGTSLIAAGLGTDRELVAIDDWSLGDGGRAQLEANLARHGVAATIVEGDAFELLRGGALGDRRVGVYYYDNGHAYEQQLDGLRLIEPSLVEGALMIVDDSDWERVEQAVDDYLADQPRAAELWRVDGKERGRPEWWEGMRVLRWT